MTKENDNLILLKNNYVNKTALVINDNYYNLDNMTNIINEKCLLVCIDETIKKFNSKCDIHYITNMNMIYEYDITKPLVVYESDLKKYNLLDDIDKGNSYDILLSLLILLKLDFYGFFKIFYLWYILLYY